jgi:hypothetical protein
MQFLTLLGRDVEIVKKRTPRSRCQGRLRVVAQAWASIHGVMILQPPVGNVRNA